MWTAALASWIHVLSLAIGLPAIFFRWRALAGGPTDVARAERAHAADNVWGLAAMTWVGSGLWRALAGTDKPWDYYANHGMFWVKMGLFGLMFLLEIGPMVVLIQWRVQKARGRPMTLEHGSWIALLSAVEVGVVLAMAFVATLMARGIGY